MIYVDNRTEQQKQDLRVGVAADDLFKSASGRTSVAIWACALADIQAVLDWVSARTDLVNTRVVPLRYFKPRRDVLGVTIHPVTAGHVALAPKTQEVAQ